MERSQSGLLHSLFQIPKVASSTLNIIDIYITDLKYDIYINEQHYVTLTKADTCNYFAESISCNSALPST